MSHPLRHFALLAPVLAAALAACGADPTVPAAPPVPGARRADLAPGAVPAQTLVWHDDSTGAVHLWRLRDTTVTDSARVTTLPGATWEIAGAPDMDGDGDADLLVRDRRSGALWTWYLTGGAVTGTAYVTTLAPSEWTLAAVADGDRDGKPDLLWRHALTEEAWIWFLDGTMIRHLQPLGQALAGAAVVGVADVNGDGFPDVVTDDRATGAAEVYVGFGDAARLQAGWGTVAALPQPWRVVGVCDLDGDGQGDLLWHDAATGALRVWHLRTGPLDGEGRGSVAVRDAAELAPAPAGWRPAALGCAAGAAGVRRPNYID